MFGIRNQSVVVLVLSSGMVLSIHLVLVGGHPKKAGKAGCIRLGLSVQVVSPRPQVSDRHKACIWLGEGSGSPGGCCWVRYGRQAEGTLFC